jgi:hypothetical protein
MENEIIKTVLSSCITKAIEMVFKGNSDATQVKIEYANQLEREKKELFQDRPELEIVEYKNYIKRTKYGLKKQCDIEIFVAHIDSHEIVGKGKYASVHFNYRKEDFNPDDRCCVIYTLKNVGKTDIASLDVICNLPRDTSFFPTNNSLKDDMLYKWAGNNLINYSVCGNRKIRVGETVTIKVCYHKDRIITPRAGVASSIGIIDVNGNCWAQSFYIPYDYIDYSYRISDCELKELCDTDKAIECFKNPWLW